MGDNKKSVTIWVWGMQWVRLLLRTHWQKRCVSDFC